MITFPLSAAHAFRAVARKGVCGRPRGPAPPVLLMPEPDAVTLVVHAGEVVIAHRITAECSTTEPVLLPTAVLDGLDGRGDEPVTIDTITKHRATVRWTDRGEGKSETMELPRVGPRHAPPPRPDVMSDVSGELLVALHEAGRTAAREGPSRFALHRVQVQGKAGRVVGSDGKTAYLHAGFRLPFGEDVLVPAVPVFGSKELASAASVRVGRTATHLVVTADAWTVFLRVDPVGRFPDVAGVVPRRSAATLVLGDEDAAAVLAALPRRSGRDEDEAPVVLDLVAERSVVRVPGGDGDHPAVVRLTNSTVRGGPARVGVGRPFLARALALGLHTLRVSGVGKPVVATGGAVTLMALARDPDEVVETEGVRSEPEPSEPERSVVMSSVDRTGRPEPPDVPDPLAEAEALRAGLVEAAHRAVRLVAVLKGKRKEQRALASVWTSLKSLALDREGRP